MTIPYPEGLPCALREGYSLKSVSPLVRTEMQSGRARQRRKFTSVPTMARVSWLMDTLQAQLFETWWEGVLVSGSQWFDMPLRTPIGIRTYMARFTDIYDGPLLTGTDLWKFTAELELRDRPILSGDWGLYAPEFVLLQDIFDLAMNREWPAA